MSGAWWTIVHEHFVLVKQMVLDHVVCNLERYHGILNRIELVNVYYSKQYKFSAERDLDLESALFKIRRLIEPRQHNLGIETVLRET